MTSANFNQAQALSRRAVATRNPAVWRQAMQLLQRNRKMQLNASDNREIDDIINHLEEEDLAAIREEVDCLTPSRNPLWDAVIGFTQHHFTAATCTGVASDNDYQLWLDNCLDELLIRHVTREYALNIFAARYHHTGEAA